MPCHEDTKAQRITKRALFYGKVQAVQIKQFCKYKAKMLIVINKNATKCCAC